MDDSSILVGGEVLIDLFGSADCLQNSSSFKRRVGGAPTNVAIGLTRLGKTPSLWTKTGSDPFGQFLQQALREHGLPSRFISTESKRNTALAFVSDNDGSMTDFTFYVDGTATANLDPTTVPDEFLRSCEWVHIGGTLLALESTRSSIFSILDRASNYECLVSFDPNTRVDLWESERVCSKTLRRAFAQVDIAKVSPSDVEPLLNPNKSPSKLVDQLISLGPHTVFLTLGSNGAYAQTTSESPWRETSIQVPGHEVKVVDETGAGDAFMAAIIFKLSDDPIDLKRAVEFANAAGALATTKQGALGKLPSPTEIEEFLH